MAPATVTEQKLDIHGGPVEISLRWSTEEGRPRSDKPQRKMKGVKNGKWRQEMDEEGRGVKTGSEPKIEQRERGGSRRMKNGTGVIGDRLHQNQYMNDTKYAARAECPTPRREMLSPMVVCSSPG